MNSGHKDREAYGKAWNSKWLFPKLSRYDKGKVSRVGAGSLDALDALGPGSKRARYHRRATKGQPNMASMRCTECGLVVPDKEWSCSNCGHPVRAEVVEKTGLQISNKGMICMVCLFVFFPILLFLLHIFVPGM